MESLSLWSRRHLSWSVLQPTKDCPTFSEPPLRHAKPEVISISVQNIGHMGHCNDLLNLNKYISCKIITQITVSYPTQNFATCIWVATHSLKISASGSSIAYSLTQSFKNFPPSPWRAYSVKLLLHSLLKRLQCVRLDHKQCYGWTLHLGMGMGSGSFTSYIRSP